MFNRSKLNSAYLKHNRLAEVLTAIQVMAVSEVYRRTPEKWAKYLSGAAEGEAAGDRWEKVFKEHPEFFRASIDFPGG